MFQTEQLINQMWMDGFSTATEPLITCQKHESIAMLQSCPA